jgi:hypothetical protein
MRQQAGRAIAAMAVATGLLALPGAEGFSAQPSHTYSTQSQSSQLFQQMFVVFEHPRCMNCHTGEAFPRQGDDRHRHTMNVTRGPADSGAAALNCSTCHQSMNQAASGVPGAAEWHLAPVRMAWIGLNAGELCRALRDPSKGAMSPQQMVPHFATSLIRWSWDPGTNAHGRARGTPPMSYAEFIALTKRWIASGAVCPE